MHFNSFNKGMIQTHDLLQQKHQQQRKKNSHFCHVIHQTPERISRRDLDKVSKYLSRLQSILVRNTFLVETYKYTLYLTVDRMRREKRTLSNSHTPTAHYPISHPCMTNHCSKFKPHMYRPYRQAKMKQSERTTVMMMMIYIF